MDSVTILPDETLFGRVSAWENLLLAYRNASRCKRGRESTAVFEHRLADQLIQLRNELKNESYTPGQYVNFYIHEPKRRRISAAPFRDRVVHHAVCNVIEPMFERRFIEDSYANRKGKGTHRAVDRLQYFSRQYRYVLRMDIIKHFPSIDHQILVAALARVLHDAKLMSLIRRIISSGDGVLEDEYDMCWFPGDDLLAQLRPRGLPIGNLTSQFWSNCYLNPFDHFVKRELNCPAYLRYVDDFALFANSKSELWFYKQQIVQRLARLRLVAHPHSAQVARTANGIPWLGFIVYPSHRCIKARKVRSSTRRLSQRYDAYQQGTISFAELDASVKGWINHVRYADSWGLRREVLRRAFVKVKN